MISQQEEELHEKIDGSSKFSAWLIQGDMKEMGNQYQEFSDFIIEIWKIF